MSQPNDYEEIMGDRYDYVGNNRYSLPPKTYNIHIRIIFKNEPSLELKGVLRYMVNESGTLHVYATDGMSILPVVVAAKGMWVRIDNMLEIGKYLVKPP